MKFKRFIDTPFNYFIEVQDKELNIFDGITLSYWEIKYDLYKHGNSRSQTNSV